MRFLQDALQFLSSWSSVENILGSTPPPPQLNTKFNPSEATIDTIHAALFTDPGTVTCRDVISSFLSQIELHNPSINAITALDPDALKEADTLDKTLGRIATDQQLQTVEYEGLPGNSSSHAPLPSTPRALISSLPLFCVPVLVKDNIDTINLPTTGACAALANNPRPIADAPTVKALRDAGAVVIGKTNLHELALDGLSVSSLGGQTRNPYDLTRTPGGSSGGTGAAIAASFAVLGLGTDTMNSVRNPASAGSLFGMRPTRGLVTRAGVMPVSYTQDAVGVMTRDLKDLATGMEIMARIGYDARDNTTALRPRKMEEGVNYVGALDDFNGVDGLDGVRLGLLERTFNRTESSETTPVNAAMNTMVKKLRSAGATVISIDEAIYNTTALKAAMDVQAYEFREGLDSYLQQLHHDRNKEQDNRTPRNLRDLYTQNDQPYLVIPSQYSLIHDALKSSTQNSSYVRRQHLIQNLTFSLKQTFSSHKLDALIYPQQQNLVVKVGSSSQSGRSGILAALTGSPVLTVPVGFSERTRDAPVGVPIGMEILGLPWEEDTLMGIAREIEMLGTVRRAPVLRSERRKGSYSKGDTGEGVEIGYVPEIVPNREDIADSYPVGTTG